MEPDRSDLDAVSDEDAGLEPDTLEMTSAGVDVGSATCHLVVSRIIMKRLGKAHSSRYVPVARTIEFQSPIRFTPYDVTGMIDADLLSSYLREWLGQYGTDLRHIDSGVVILTGEALRKRNARAIADQMSALTGDFVCAAAGDLFEASMAAWGSGAVERSRHLGPTLNIDIGGGTTKVSVCVDGRIVSRSALRVGSRLVVTDDDLVLTKVDGPVATLAGASAGSWLVGERVTADMRDELAEAMVDAVEGFLGLNDRAAERYQSLWIAPPPVMGVTIQNVVFSSGLAEYLYGNEDRDFKDLAIPMARVVQRRLSQGVWPWKVLDPPSSAIRATVTGLSQQTVEMSGDTVHVSPAARLPWRNALCVDVDVEQLTSASQISDAMVTAASTVEVVSVGSTLMSWVVKAGKSRDYQRLKVLAEGLADGAQRSGHGQLAVFLSEDLAKSVGRLITDELRLMSEVVVLDGIQVTGGEFVDIGRVISPNATVPVIVKSLLFGEMSNVPAMAAAASYGT